ncbi:hypothetical protein BDV18DRAFT_18199 [Aspergillus unguis]
MTMSPSLMDYSPPYSSTSLPLAKLPPSPPAELDLSLTDKKEDMVLTHSDTDSFVDSWPSSPDLDLDIEPETLSKIQQKLEHLWQLYNDGKGLFSRRMLASLDAQIDQGVDEVTIEDLDGVRQKYSLKIPEWCMDFTTTSYRISYNSIQNLTCIHPSFPELSLREKSPISICYTSSTEIYHKAPLPEVQAAFTKNAHQWEESQTCKDLTRHLTELVKQGRMSKSITKIVGFGLGSTSSLEDGFHTVRAHAQHAAMKTMARILAKRKEKEKGHSSRAGSPEIKCYAQDPAYNDVDEGLLSSIGITTLDDPKGFLEIDESTLVFSVSPNVPVKQVVADVQWPAAMIWNTVYPEKKEARWEKKVRDGEEFWVVPFTTDPDSQRVRSMVQHYTSMPLRDSNEYFGDLTIYAM